MSEFKYDITKNIKVLSEGAKGWTKEFNMVSWNGRNPKYDIRDWNHDEGKMGKGVTLTREELEELREAIDEVLIRGEDY